MAEAMKVLVQASTPFAIRGGGHMPISNAANVNSSGILLSTLALNELELSDDKTTIKIGAGNKWGQVYEYLEPFKLAVVGGRAGLVGVSGFLLGGGISFFGNQYGWASANVVRFDCVLANGQIVTATSDNDYADLYWALRGGGNSFAIVTSFHLKTLSLPAVTIGDAAYGSDVGAEFLDHVYNFAHYGSQDAKAGIEPMVRSINGQLSYHNIMFFDGKDTSPAALVNFTEVLKPVSSTFQVRPSMYNWTQEADAGRSALRGLRARFHVVSIVADREAIGAVHDTFLDTLRVETEGVANLVAALVFVPITEEYIRASARSGTDPMDLDPTRAPYLFAESTILWSESADDQTIDTFLRGFQSKLDNSLKDLNDVTTNATNPFYPSRSPSIEAIL